MQEYDFGGARIDAGDAEHFETVSTHGDEEDGGISGAFAVVWSHRVMDSVCQWLSKSIELRSTGPFGFSEQPAESLPFDKLRAAVPTWVL